MYPGRLSSALRLFHFFSVVVFFYFTSVQLIRSYGNEVLSSNSTSCGNISLYHISITNETHRTWFLIMAQVHHPPAVILVNAKADSQLNVNCSRLNTSNVLEYRDSVYINNVIQSYGWILHRIMRYNDTDNSGIIPDAVSTSTKTFLGSNLNWTLTRFDSDKEPVTVEFQAHQSLDSHEKINGAIKLIFQVYHNPMKPIKTLYYEIDNSLTILTELILDQVDVVNEVQRFSPVLLIFSNHSLKDDQDYLEQSAIQVNAEEGPLGRNIQSTFIELGTRKSKSDNHKEWITPNAYLQFPAAFWTNSEETKAQKFLLGLGIPNIVVTEPPSNTSTTSSIVGAFLGGIAIICGIVIGVYSVRRARVRYHRIPPSNAIDEVPENINDNNSDGDLNTNGRYVEQYQYEKLVQPLPVVSLNHGENSQSVHLFNPVNHLQTSALISDVPPAYGSLSFRSDQPNY
ncbi:unnamed protein product [Trichobilharzia szidati]|nr:unnamed protein product [Trichobilharzia szidati]